MTRTEPPPNPVGVAFWVGGTIVALATVLLIAHPELWLWMAAVWAVAGLLGLGIVAAEACEEAKGLRNQLRAEREAHTAESADVVRVPVLRVVPPQSTGEHDRLPVADESWLDETPLFRDDDGRWK